MMKHLLNYYRLKKDEIEKRLNEFEQNKDYFYELCFCILTPQSSAKKAWDCIKRLKKANFKNKNINPEKYIRGIRFHVNKSRYLLEFKKNHHEIIKKIKENQYPKQLREFLVKNVKGYGYKEASLPYDEEIIILIEGKTEFMKIGEFYNNYKKRVYNNKKIETFSFNPKNLKYEIAPITNAFKHYYKKNLYEINLVTGRRAMITGDHSIFGIIDSKVMPIEVRSLKKGGFIAVPKKLNIKLNKENKIINLIEKFIKEDIIKDIYAKSGPYCNYLRKKYGNKLKRNNQNTQHFGGIIPLTFLKKLPPESYNTILLKKYNVNLSFRRSPIIVKSLINTNKEFFWVLGILIAEASITKNSIEFTLGLEEYNRHLRLNKYLNEVFGVKVNSYKPKNRNVYLSKVNSVIFFKTINHLLDIKGKSLTKKVPKIVFESSFDNRIAFLQGYWEGDGWKKSKINLSVSTNSINLANSLMYLFLTLGILSRVCKKKNIKGKGEPSYCIEVDNIIKPNDIKDNKLIRKNEIVPDIGILLHKIHKDLGLKSKINSIHTPLYQRIITWKSNINQPRKESIKKVLDEFKKYKMNDEILSIKKILNSDLSFVKIKEIKRISYERLYVYDIEVASKDKNYQNFVGGFGGVCMHNSHCLRNIGYKELAILDRHVLKNLKKYGVIKNIPISLTPKKYFEIEDKFLEFSNKLNIPIDYLDLLFWSQETGEIFK